MFNIDYLQDLIFIILLSNIKRKQHIFVVAFLKLKLLKTVSSKSFYDYVVFIKFFFNFAPAFDVKILSKS